jgi:hypothetical protein
LKGTLEANRHIVIVRMVRAEFPIQFFPTSKNTGAQFAPVIPPRTSEPQPMRATRLALTEETSNSLSLGWIQARTGAEIFIKIEPVDAVSFTQKFEIPTLTIRSSSRSPRARKP